MRIIKVNNRIYFAIKTTKGNVISDSLNIILNEIKKDYIRS